MTRGAIIPPSDPPRPLDSGPAAGHARHDGRGRRRLLVVASTDVEVDHGNSTRLDGPPGGCGGPGAAWGGGLNPGVPGVCGGGAVGAAHNPIPAGGGRPGPAPGLFPPNASPLSRAHKVPVPAAAPAL